MPRNGKIEGNLLACEEKGVEWAVIWPLYGVALLIRSSSGHTTWTFHQNERKSMLQAGLVVPSK